jgi:hypothetical protein
LTRTRAAFISALMIDDAIFEVTGPVWVWRATPPRAGAWHFLRVEGQIAAEIRFASFDNARGFGSVPVTASTGSTVWRTSLFRDGKDGGYLLPLKAAVRQSEAIGEGDVITARLTL